MSPNLYKNESGLYELYAMQPSLYSAKARACLQYKRLPYVEKPANIDRIAQVIIPRTGSHFMPMVLTPDDTPLQDSCDIVEELERRHPQRPVFPADPVLKTLALIFETFCDEFFALCGAYYRWGREHNKQWSIDMFLALAGHQVANKAVAASLADGLKQSVEKRVRSSGTDRPEICEAIETAFKEICLAMEDHFRADHPFLLGDHPSLADLAMMNGLYGHQWRDYSDALAFLHKECILLGVYLDRLHCAAGESDEGDLYVAETLKPVLRAMGKHFGHSVKILLPAVDEALAGHPLGPLTKRSTAPMDTFIGEVPTNRKMGIYSGWKLQRVIDAYRQIPKDRLEEADELIGMCGFLEACRHQPKWRMEKRNFKLEVTENG